MVVAMSCPWLGGVWKPNYAVYVFVGRPGAGKTTAALHLVAYDLWRRGVASDYREALREAGRRLFLGRSLEELFEYILEHVDNPATDWLVVDDAAVGFHDFADPLVWSKFVDIIKTARNSVAARGIIFTTTSIKYLSTRVRHSAYVYYVKRDDLNIATYKTPSGGCIISESPQASRYVAIVEVETTLVGNIHFARWNRADLETKWRLVGAIPVSPEFAMPAEVEEVHVKTRKERVKRAAEEALERLRRRDGQDAGSGGKMAKKWRKSI
jgi:hypothetical protein